MRGGEERANELLVSYAVVSILSSALDMPAEEERVLHLEGSR